MGIVNELTAPVTRNKTDPYVQPATRTTTPFEQAQAAPAAPAAPAALPPPATGGNATATASTAVRPVRPRNGIVNSAAPTAPPPDPTAAFAPTGPKGEDYQPITAEVQQNQTVQGQLGDILKTGNPLLEAAKARAAQVANSRGLQNSSMATQAGEEAIVNTALPIAQQDAATYQKQALVNQDIANQFLSTKMGAKLDLEGAYEAFKKNNYMFDKDEKLKRYINDSGITSNEKIAAMQAAAQVSSASISAGASMYSTDERLKEAGMTIEANKAYQEAGFTQQDKTNMNAYAHENSRDLFSSINQVAGADIPPESKQAWMHDIMVFNSGRPLDVTIDISAFQTGTSPKPAQP